MKRLFIAINLIGLAGCAYPTKSIDQGANQGHFRISDAPLGTSIMIDGRDAGVRTAAKFDLISVDAGRHRLEETIGGRVLLNAEYMIDAGSTVEVRTPK